MCLRAFRGGENGEVSSGVAVNVLGPLEVRRDGVLVTIEGLKRRQLLAVLVAARGAERERRSPR